MILLIMRNQKKKNSHFLSVVKWNRDLSIKDEKQNIAVREKTGFIYDGGEETACRQ